MSNFCITINIMYHRDIDKIKIDFGCVPTTYLKYENKKWFFKSDVSNEIFVTNKRKYKNYELYYNFYKKKDQVLFQGIFPDFLNDDLIQFEKCFLPIVESFIRGKIPFRFKTKKFLKERIKKILG